MWKCVRRAARLRQFWQIALVIAFGGALVTTAAGEANIPGRQQ